MLNKRSTHSLRRAQAQQFLEERYSVGIRSTQCEYWRFWHRLMMIAIAHEVHFLSIRNDHWKQDIAFRIHDFSIFAISEIQKNRQWDPNSSNIKYYIYHRSIGAWSNSLCNGPLVKVPSGFEQPIVIGCVALSQGNRWKRGTGRTDAQKGTHKCVVRESYIKG